jgi:hypothetical protein
VPDFKKYFKLNEQLLKGVKLLQNSKIPLMGGNCDMVALALYKWIKETTDIDLNIVFSSNVEDESDLMEEPDIYHVFLSDGTNFYDGDGKTSGSNIADWIENEYGNSDPAIYIFSPNELDKSQKIIRNETNWNTDWSEFYSILTKGEIK